MSIYNIAGLNVSMNPRGATLLSRAKKYLTSEQNNEENCQIKIDLNRDKVIACMNTYGHFDYDSSEYHWGGYEFFKSMIDYNGIFFHSSAIAYENKAYLFSAPKGTGKSTHTKQWVKYFGEDKVTYINDDKPVIRLMGDKFCACGSPFSGKNDVSNNIIVPIAGICFLERGTTNYIKRLLPFEALSMLLNEVMVCKEENFMDKTLTLCEKLMEQVPMYKLKCNISKEAVETSYEMMCK